MWCPAVPARCFLVARWTSCLGDAVGTKGECCGQSFLYSICCPKPTSEWCQSAAQPPSSLPALLICMQALLCLEAAAAGALRSSAPLAVRQSLLSEEAAPLLGYLSSLLLQVSAGQACWAGLAGLGRAPTCWAAYISPVA